MAKAISVEEQVFQNASTPTNAWMLTRMLQFGAAVTSESWLSLRRRSVDIWSDQVRRFPGHPWIEQRLAEAQSALAHR